MLVQLSYFFGREDFLALRESAEPMPILEAQDLQPRGDLLVGEDRTTHPPWANVRLEQGGTHVELEALEAMG